MTGYDKRVYEMLVRVAVFYKTHPHLFERNSLAVQEMKQIESAVEKLAAQDSALVGDDTGVRLSATDRARARTALRETLDAISRTGRALQRAEFSMPRRRSDGTLVSVGKLWTQHLPAVKQMFIDGGMPDDFIEKLQTAIAEVERCIRDQFESNDKRFRTAQTIRQTRGNAIAALGRVEPILDNLLRDDPPLLAVWRRARRVERSYVSRSGVEEQPVAVPS